MSADSFASEVLRTLVSSQPQAVFIQVRTRGKTATLGYLDHTEWVPLFRLTHASPTFAIANLQVRQGRRWQPTMVRGSAATIADELAGPLQFTWQFHAKISAPSNHDEKRGSHF